MNIKKLFEKNQFYILCAAVLGVYIFMHYYMLAGIPKGLHIDEAGAGYDAYCLANWGIDRYMKYRPVYLINFGGGQSALYAYACIPFIKMMGLTTQSIRMPAFLFSFVTFFSVLFIFKKLFNKKIAVLALIFLTILPYFTMQSRFGLDCNLLLPMSSLSICMLIYTVDRQKKWLYVLTGCVWGITLYTYVLSYLIVPVFLILAGIYMLFVKKIRWNELLIMVFVIIVIALPLLATVVINQFDLNEIVTPWFTIPKLTEYRGNEIVFSDLFKNLLVSVKSVLYKDWIPYNALDTFYTLFKISVPFVAVGFFYSVYKLILSIQKRSYEPIHLLLIWGIAEIAIGCVLGGDGPNINKLNGIFIAVLFFLIYGLINVYGFIWRITVGTDEKTCGGISGELAKCKNAPKYFLVVLACIYGVQFFSFSSYYFNKYPIESEPQMLFQETYTDLLVELGDGIVYSGTTYIDSSYIYYLLSTKMAPHDYNAVRKDDKSCGNLEFYLPETIDKSATYIVRNCNSDYIEKLKQYEFHSIVAGDYTAFFK